MKNLIFLILTVFCSTTAFADCEEKSSFELKEMSREELVKQHCRTKILFREEMQTTTAKIRSGALWSNDREQQCSRELERISREFKSRFPHEKLDCVEETARY
jgi:hypothetical protein